MRLRDRLRKLEGDRPAATARKAEMMHDARAFEQRIEALAANCADDERTTLVGFRQAVIASGNRLLMRAFRFAHYDDLFL